MPDEATASDSSRISTMLCAITFVSASKSPKTSDTVSEPAWRSTPSWYLVAGDDRMIPPPAQRAMAERMGATTVEARGSHSIYVSQPSATAELIQRAARVESAQPV